MNIWKKGADYQNDLYGVGEFLGITPGETDNWLTDLKYGNKTKTYATLVLDRLWSLYDNEKDTGFKDFVKELLGNNNPFEKYDKTTFADGYWGDKSNQLAQLYAQYYSRNGEVFNPKWKQLRERLNSNGGDSTNDSWNAVSDWVLNDRSQAIQTLSGLLADESMKQANTLGENDKLRIINLALNRKGRRGAYGSLDFGNGNRGNLSGQIDAVKGYFKDNSKALDYIENAYGNSDNWKKRFGNKFGKHDFRNLLDEMIKNNFLVPAQQQGGQLNTNDPRTQIIGLVQAAMQGDQQAQETISQIQQAAQQGNEEAAQILQMIQEVVSELQQESQQEAGANAAGVPMARYGAKLSYIKKLKGECAEGEEAYYYKIGGKICKKCQKIKKNNCGAKVKSAKKGCSAAVTDFRNSRQKYQEGGNVTKPITKAEEGTSLQGLQKPITRKPIVETLPNGTVLVSGGETYTNEPGGIVHERLNSNGYVIDNVYDMENPNSRPFRTNTTFFYPNGKNITKEVINGKTSFLVGGRTIPTNSGKQHFERERSKYVRK